MTPENGGVGGRSAYGLIRQVPGFRALWCSRAVSHVGGSLSTVALIVYVAEQVGSGRAVALLLLVGELLPTLFSPVAGALADRLPPRRLLVTCELAQGAVLAVVAATVPPLPVLLALIAVKTLFAVLLEPAARAAVPRLVPDAELASANAALGLGTHGLDVAGPLLAAALLPALGVRGVLWVDVATFGLSAVLLAGLPRLSTVERPVAAPDLWTDTVDGLRYLARHRTVRVLALGFWAVVLCTALDDVVLVFLARDTYAAGNLAISLLYAGAGLGLLLGFLLLSRIGHRYAAAGLFVAGLAISSAGNLATGLAGAVVLAVACQAIRGLGLSMVDTGLPAEVARIVPAHLRGRAFAAIYGGVSLAAVLSYVVGGLVLDVVSPPVVLVVAGGLGVLAAVATGAAVRLR